MIGFLIGALVALFLALLAVYAVIQLLRTATGLNGAQAMRQFYWVLLLIAIWIAVAVACFLLVVFLFHPVLELVVGRDAKGGAFGPLILIMGLVFSLMAVPLIATKATTFVRSLARTRNATKQAATATQRRSGQK